MQGRRLIAFTALQVLSVVFAFYILVTWHSPWNLSRYIGTALVLVGVTGVAFARFRLGRSFSLTPQARQLVTQGVYSKIRNPIYVFGALFMTGLLLVLQYPGPVPWILLAAIICGQTLRARKEARVLEAAFGDEYREYRRKTWF